LLAIGLEAADALMEVVERTDSQAVRIESVAEISRVEEEEIETLLEEAPEDRAGITALVLERVETEALQAWDLGADSAEAVPIVKVGDKWHFDCKYSRQTGRFSLAEPGRGLEWSHWRENCPRY
jgi:hypothetical protein